MSENKEKNDDIIEYGQTDLDKNKEHKKIHPSTPYNHLFKLFTS